MLTINQIEKYYSPNQFLNKKNILVEYVQHELLDSLFKQKGSELLSFIGGTSIRIVYEGGRFSEDLDFDNFGLSFENFDRLTQDIVTDMKQKGFDIEFRILAKGAYHCYLKFPHILQKAELTQHQNEKILVRIDTVQKNKLFEPAIFTLNRFNIYRDILVNPIDIILSQKLIAILERKRERGRDLYDVSFLYGMTQPNFSYIEKYLQISRSEFITRILERCEKFDYDYLARDVAPFVIDQNQLTRVKNFKRFIFSKLQSENTV